MNSTLKGGVCVGGEEEREGVGLKTKMRCYSTKGVGEGGFEGSRRPIFIFFIKEKWICAMSRHHVIDKKPFF